MPTSNFWATRVMASCDALRSRKSSASARRMSSDRWISAASAGRVLICSLVRRMRRRCISSRMRGHFSRTSGFRYGMSVWDQTTRSVRPPVCCTSRNA